MNDVSGAGLSITIFASGTFPNGLTITQFADDSDPLDFPVVNLNDASTMGLNGDLITMSSVEGVPMVISVIPNSEDDINLQILAKANKTTKTKKSVKDTIKAVTSYGDGSKTTTTGGVITSAPLSPGVSSSKRLKSHVYSFMFEEIA